MQNPSRIRSSVQPITRKTTTSVVLFDATRKHPAPKTFAQGHGLTRWVGSYGGRQNYSASDVAEMAQLFGDLASMEAAEDRHFDELAEESRRLSAYEMGLVFA